MRTPSENFSKFESLAQVWLNELNTYTEEQFLRKSSEENWSVGQVYEHLIRATEVLHIGQVRQCLQMNDSNAAGEKNIKGKISYTLGMFLPVKIKVPPSLGYTPPQPKSKKDVEERMKNLLPLVKGFLPLLENANPNNKTVHPGLGYLNAREWYQIIGMHFHHHLRQKSRIDKFLGVHK